MYKKPKLGFNRYSQADVCFVFAVLTQQRGEGENEAAKEHIAVHEGQLSKMSGSKERGVDLSDVIFIFNFCATLAHPEV